MVDVIEHADRARRGEGTEGATHGIQRPGRDAGRPLAKQEQGKGTQRDGSGRGRGGHAAQGAAQPLARKTAQGLGGDGTAIVERIVAGLDDEGCAQPGMVGNVLEFVSALAAGVRGK